MPDGITYTDPNGELDARSTRNALRAAVVRFADFVLSRCTSTTEPGLVAWLGVSGPQEKGNAAVTACRYVDSPVGYSSLTFSHPTS